MTREEQIDWLCRLRADLNNGIIFTPWNKEFTKALTSILEQQPCEDCIIEWKKDFKGYVNSLSIPRDDYNGIIEYINELHVTPQPNMGRWIESHIPESTLCECSVCGFSCGAYSFNFCPNCGAKMEKEET